MLFNLATYPQPTSDPWPLPGPRPPHPGGSTEQSYPEIPESHRHLAVFQIGFWCVWGLSGQGDCVLQETESEEGRHCLLFLTWCLLRWLHLNGFLWHLHNSNNHQLEYFPYRDASLSSQKCVLFFLFRMLYRKYSDIFSYDKLYNYFKRGRVFDIFVTVWTETECPFPKLKAKIF